MDNPMKAKSPDKKSHLSYERFECTIKSKAYNLPAKQKHKLVLS